MKKKVSNFFEKNKWELDQLMFLLILILMFLSFYLGSAAFILYTLFLCIQNRKHLRTIIKKNFLFYIFVLYSLAVGIYNQTLSGMTVPLVYAFGFFFFYFYLQQIKAKTYYLSLKVIALAIIPLTVMCLYTYLNYALGHGYGPWYIFKYANIQTRAEATFFNANYYGMYCLMALVTNLYIMKKESNHKWLLLGSGAIGAVLISIILTASRMLLPTLVIVLIWMLAWLQPRWVKYIIGLALVGGMVLTLKPGLIPRMETLTYAFQDRFNLWAVGLAIFLSRPLFGRGAMAFVNFYYLYSDYAQMHAHNLYINTLANYGVLGATLILVLLKPLWHHLITLFKDKSLRPEFALISAYILIVLVHGTMDVAIFWVQTAYIVLIVILVSKEELEKLK